MTISVHFMVSNSKRPAVLCPSDGQDYSISGQLTGPAAQPNPGQSPGATLYLHGLGFAGW